MNITIFGGSGFVGQKLTEELTSRGHNVTSISVWPAGRLNRSMVKKATWVHSDILQDTHWHSAVKHADWVIDTIGILWEHPNKKITYDRFILQPVQLILDYLQKHNPTAEFLFISANSAPLPLRKYMDAKLQAEQLIKDSSQPYTIVYPSFVVGKARFLSITGGRVITFMQKIPGVRKLVQNYTPISVRKTRSRTVECGGGENVALHATTDIKKQDMFFFN